MKKLLRPLKKRLSRRFLPKLLYLLMRALYATMRVRIVGAEIPRAFHEKGEGVINVFWHGRLLLTQFAYEGKELHVLASPHGDGEIIGKVSKYFGFHLVRGSSNKRGAGALMELVRLARKNCDLVITPDGPRGPAEVVKPGVAQVARITGRPVIPSAFSSSRAKEFRSWDRFRLPYPFSRAVFVWGEPLYYREGEDMEEFRRRIENAPEGYDDQGRPVFSLMMRRVYDTVLWLALLS